MEIQKTSIGDVTYRGKTFINITSQLKQNNVPPDGFVPSTKGVRVDTSPEKLRTDASRIYNASGSYGSNTAMTAAAKAINQERDEAISQFLDGNMSQEELADTFEQLLNKFRDACNENDFPTVLGLGLHQDEGLSEAFYSDFRAQILKLAVQRNDDEGRQYITGEIDTQRNWKYYNSDYYFLSEDALAALDKGLEQFLDHVDIEGYKLDIPDYKAQGMDNCYNFNSAWSAYSDAGCWYGDADQFMRNFDAVPPKGFEWFYQSGGDAKSTTAEVLRTATVGPDGKEVVLYQKDFSQFDPKDSNSATTWAAYRDSNGVRHIVSRIFAYDHSEADLKVVSSLLKFTGNKNEDAAFNRFLDSLQVCKKGHYRRFDLIRAVDLWA